MAKYVPRHAIGHRGHYGQGATWYVNQNLSDTRHVGRHVVRDAAQRLTTDALAEYGFAGSKLARADSQRLIVMSQTIIARDIQNLLDSIEMLP